MKKLKSQTDNSIQKLVTLFVDAVIGEQEKYKVLYRIMHLIDNQYLTDDERIDLAFRYDAGDT